MGDSEIAKIPYDERNDDQKLASNWKKARAQYKREDWSACVVRAATATEIAANIYVRRYLLVDHSLPPLFVDALLLGANGLDGKFSRLITPAAKCQDTWQTLKAVKPAIELLNRHRNGVVHSGKFQSKKDAEAAFGAAVAIIRVLAPDASGSLLLPFEDVEQNKPGAPTETSNGGA